MMSGRKLFIRDICRQGIRSTQLGEVVDMEEPILDKKHYSKKGLLLRHDVIAIWGKNARIAIFSRFRMLREVIENLA